MYDFSYIGLGGPRNNVALISSASVCCLQQCLLLLLPDHLYEHVPTIKHRMVHGVSDFFFFFSLLKVRTSSSIRSVFPFGKAYLIPPAFSIQFLLQFLVFYLVFYENNLPPFWLLFLFKKDFVYKKLKDIKTLRGYLEHIILKINIFYQKKNPPWGKAYTHPTRKENGLSERDSSTS